MAHHGHVIRRTVDQRNGKGEGEQGKGGLALCAALCTYVYREFEVWYTRANTSTSNFH